jgi:rubrerythrin
MASIKGTRTEQNLLKAFAGESQARNRYQMFAKQAEKEGFRQIADIFMETADNERVHAGRFFSYLEGGDVEITATYPAGKVGTTLENLKAAAMGENEEWTTLYPEFARIAREEGFPKVAATFDFISKAEIEHENRYNKLASNIENDIVFKRDEVVRWKCNKCGYVHEGNEAPEVCPTCLHDKAHFELKETNY